jgi:UDP-N-acetylglucosamine--N-acetylmuramyl-(pentapeptide) pyrophosphoryl-undecaprenol N-acetylglucosamine transferase
MNNSTSSAKKNGFFICGLTGGPYFPIPAVTKNLPQICPILIGVKNSFEEKVAKSSKLPIHFLPIAKLDFLSFKSKSNILFKIVSLFQLIKVTIILFFSLIKSLYLLIKYQPAIIYSTGSFLAVPIIWASKFTNFLDLTNTLVVVHQQDPKVGLANRLTVKSADITSCVFEYTKNKYKIFEKAMVIPNPILPEKYDSLDKLSDRKLDLFVNNVSIENEYEKTKKPLFLIFGGGSGSSQINDWVKQNLSYLSKKFRIIHLTGFINSSNNFLSDDYYYQTEGLTDDMQKVLSRCDIILCRAGLGSISELLYLKTKSPQSVFLVPLAGTHQELNADLVKEYFNILDNENPETWLNKINENFNDKEDLISNTFNQEILNSYYQKLNIEINRLF